MIIRISCAWSSLPSLSLVIKTFTLDPLKFSVSDPSFISREEVKAMVKEIQSNVAQYHEPPYRENLRREIEAISSKYLSPK